MTPALTAAVAGLLAGLMACGGSSSNTMTSPTSTTRCAVSLSVADASLPASGGTGSASIAVNRECSWEASSDVGWIVVNTARTGQGAGSLGFTVAANPQPQPRSGQLVVNDARATLTQAGAACQFAIDTAVGTVSAQGGTLRVQVATVAGCAWSALSQVPWVRVATGSTGDGPGSVTLEVEANPGQPRTGIVLVAGLPYTVAQEAGAPVPPGDGCVLTVAPTSLRVPASGGTVSVALTGDARCAWTVSSQVPWLAAVGPTSGQGPASLAFSAAPNPTTAVRTGTVVVAGRPLLVVQDAAAPPTPPVTGCSYALAPASQQSPAAGGPLTVTLTTAAECPWTASTSASWLVVAGATSGVGPATIALTAQSNASGNVRTASVVVAGQSATVTQQASGGTPTPSTCLFDVSPPALSVEAAAANVSVSITASDAACAWTATSAVPWITITTPGGTGSGQAALTIAPNAETTPRSGSITVAGRSVLVTQAGQSQTPSTCSYTVAPGALTVPSTGGMTQVSVSASATTCTWTASANAAWLTITGGSTGSGAGTVTIQAAPNDTAGARTTTLLVAGQTVTVTQEAPPPPPCSYQLMPQTATVPSDGGAVTARIETSASCGWTATTQVPWITVTGPASGTGPADLVFTVAANTTTAARTGTVTVAGQTLTVMQEAPPPPACTYQLTPSTATVAADGGAVGARIETGASCTWTAASQAPWITVTGPASGTGPADLAFTIAANATTASRTGTATVGGQTLTITQEAPPPPPTCTFSVAPSSLSAGAAGGAAQITVTASAASCAWTASSQSPWIVIVSGTQGTGSGTVAIDVAANPSTTARTGALLVAGQTVEVVQAGQTATPVTLNGRTAELSGTCPTLSFKIMGTAIVTDASTTFEGLPCTALRNGTDVSVEGLAPPGGGPVIATRVRATP